MLIRLVSIEARPGDRLIRNPEDEPMLGYFQTFGVTASDEAELKDRIQEYLRSDLGSELLGIEESWLPDFEGGGS